MRIRVINPNTTASMTAKIAEAARAAASPGTVIEACNPQDGPVSIEGHYDEAHALPGLLDLVRAGDAAGIDGFVIACADDPGLAAAREVARAPVLGITEAAIKMASVVGDGFSIVTTVSRAIPSFRALARRYCAEHVLCSVRAADIAVLDLEDPTSGAAEKVRCTVLRAAREDGAEAIVLGCAGMADLPRWLSDETGIPVIDGVAAATRLMEAVCGLGLRTCKTGSLAFPFAKPFRGVMAPHALTEA